MDCRIARPYLIGEQVLTPDEQQAFHAHLAQCAACRDDQNDLLSRALVQTTRELALPPPDFSAKLLRQLPAQSPLQLAARTAQRRRILQRMIGFGVAALGLLAVVAGLSFQALWAGTSLGLVSETILAAAAAALAPLVIMVASAVAVALLLQNVAQLPTASRALGSTLVAGLLLLSAAAATLLSDTLNTRGDGQAASTIATLLRPIHVAAPLQGDVVSLAGDITVDSTVSGNVASVAGRVTLAPAAVVSGNVLAGAGQLHGSAAQVLGSIRPATGLWAAAAMGLGATSVSLSPALVRTLSLLLGALMTLVLAGLVVMIWPQRILQTSRLLPSQPWTALGLGMLITILLVLLALPVLALLAATVVGLLLVPVLLMAVHLPYVQGLAAVGQALGQRLTGAATTMSALWGVAAQLVLVIGLGLFAPVAGLVAFYLLASLGIGADILARRLA